MRYATLTIISILMFCALHGCGKKNKTADGTVGASEESVDASSTAPSQMKSIVQSASAAFEYPKARWRMATFGDLDRTTLWLGHLVIRHDKSKPDSFRQGFWRPDPPNPTRSADEALALAEKIAVRAAAAPDNFEQLARQYSEDVVSRDNGGMLGGVRASQLTSSGFLDVLAALKPGEVSKPFQTPYGYHILKRYPPPTEEQVAGERIVIGYQGVFALANESTRSRAEALKLARDVAAKAKKGDQDFRTLVERYSDNMDRDRRGDMGVYSTRDPEYLPVEIHRLSQLDVGEITGPMDSPFGFEILRRVPVEPRAEYAMTAIKLPFDSSPSAREASRAQTLKQAEEMRRAIESNPERFEEFQRLHRSEGITRWTSGRGEPGLSRALDAIVLGEVAPTPLLHFNSYMIVKRLDPDSLPPEKPLLTELPNPDEPNYDALMKYNPGKKIAGAARAFAEAVQTDDKFTPESAQRIAEMLGDLAVNLELYSNDPNAVRDAIYTTLGLLESRLNADQFSQFKSVGRRWAIRQIMPPGSVN